MINGGEILLVEDKDTLMRRMGRKEMEIELHDPIREVPAGLERYSLRLEDDGRSLGYTYDTAAERTGITSLLRDLQAAGVTLKDVQTRQSSLEEIFVGIVKERGQ